MIKSETVSAPAGKPRDDILVSICFGDLSASRFSFDAIVRLASEINGRFRFYEFVVVVEESRGDAYRSLIHLVENLRLFTVRDGTAFYRRRVIAAEEAIGDVVLLASTTELPAVDALGMIERAVDEQTSVLVTRSAKGPIRIISALLVCLGQIAKFRVNLQDFQTLALPRTLLNQLLAHPDPDLALRFPPQDIRVPLVIVEGACFIDVPREAGMRRRLLLLQKLLVYMAPRLLMAVTLASGILATWGFLFGLYAVAVWLVQDKVAPGWLTLSAAISLTAFFLGFSLAGLSLGLQQLLLQTNRDDLGGIISEVNRIDIFGQVTSELNVEYERTRTRLREPSTR